MPHFMPARVRWCHSMTRARRDFGTVRKRANGRWQAYYVGPDQAFHRRRPRSRRRSTPRGGSRRNGASCRTTSGRRRNPGAPKWFARRSSSVPARRRLAQATRAQASHEGALPSSLDRLLLPAFGDVSLRDISPQAVRTWHSSLDATRPTQRAHVYGLLRSILSTAVADNPDCEPLPRPRRWHRTARPPIEPATLSELEVILGEMPARYRALVLMGAWCGLRFGELIELRRKDLDLKQGVVRIRRGVVRIDGKVTVGTPKSEAGIRDVAIPPHLLPVLRAHLRDHVGVGGEALLFPSVRDREVQVHSNTIRRHWLKARVAAVDPDLRVHDLRHTGAVLAAQSGATLAELMARIGHSTPQAALRYQHAAQGRDAEIAERMSRQHEEVVQEKSLGWGLTKPRRCGWRQGSFRGLRRQG